MNCDPDEIVMFHGRGNITLRSAVREVMAKTPTERQMITLLRDEGKKPSVMDISHVEKLAKLPEYQTQTQEREK